MALGSHLITVRRLKKYIDDVIGKKANLPDTSKTIIGNISRINSDLTNNTCVNLLNPTARTQTVNGVTFTNNGDGTYTVNGAASNVAYIIINNRFDLIPFRGKSLRIVGCPSGGGTNAYQFNINIYDTPGNLIGSRTEYGEGISFEVPTNASKSAMVIAVRNGQTVNNLLFKPMLTTDLNAKYSDYVPYAGSSGRLNENVAEMYRNLIVPQYKEVHLHPTTSQQLYTDSDLVGALWVDLLLKNAQNETLNRTFRVYGGATTCSESSVGFTNKETVGATLFPDVGGRLYYQIMDLVGWTDNVLEIVGIMIFK